MRLIAVRDLRNRNAEIIDAVSRGESFTVTRRGEPVAELRPISRGRRVFVPRTDILALARRSGRIDFHAFRRDLDRVADPRVG